VPERTATGFRAKKILIKSLHRKGSALALQFFKI
jgi:hypothetical protein